MSLSTDKILNTLKRACDWQLENLSENWRDSSGRRIPIQSTSWIRGTFYAGVFATWQLTRDQKYLDAVLGWAEGNGWQPGPRARHADDHCVGQTYLDLYLLKNDPRMIGPIRQVFDQIVEDPLPGRLVWWWSDALFMAPAALARMGSATGEGKYLTRMNTMWWDAVDLLFDPEHQLFFRDAKYIPKSDRSGPRENNGRQIFWSRGNGWVMAGIVRVLENLPSTFRARTGYQRLLEALAQAVIRYQDAADGLWRSSLLDPASYPNPETSGSALFCFALTWAINQGVLSRAQYRPVIEKCWQGLMNAIDSDGKLGWVQLPGERPAHVRQPDSIEYGTGALLLAGCEVAKLYQSTVK